MLQLAGDSSNEDELFEAQHRQRVEYLNAVDFCERFRLMPWQFELLLTTTGPQISTQSQTSTAMFPKYKLMAALRFYASNNFYYSIGDAQVKCFVNLVDYVGLILGFSKRAVYDAIRAVTDAINRQLFGQLIRWPTTGAENQQIELDFYRLKDVGIAGICGAIDGPLIPIKPPKDVERFYVDRHDDHSLNPTVVSDANYILR